MDNTAPYEIVKLPDPPVVQCTFLPPYRMGQHFKELARVLLATMREASDSYMLVDLRALRMEWFEVIGALVDIREVRHTNERPTNRGLLIVTHSDILKLGAKALVQRQYEGSGSVHVFETVEAALDFARSASLTESGDAR
jgi:hypothetical protein